jgi:hypothetical protein
MLDLGEYEVPEGAEVEVKFSLPPEAQQMCFEISKLISDRVAEISAEHVYETMPQSLRFRGVQRAKRAIANDPTIKKLQSDITAIHSFYGRNTLIVRPKL